MTTAVELTSFASAYKNRNEKGSLWQVFEYSLQELVRVDRILTSGAGPGSHHIRGTLVPRLVLYNMRVGGDRRDVHLLRDVLHRRARAHFGRRQ